MKVLVISHSCVTDVNQQQFVALNTIPNTHVALVIPAVWRSEYSGKRHEPSLLPSITFPIYQFPIALPGHVSLHFYTRLPLKCLRRFGPDVLLSTQEPWSLSGLQAVWLAHHLHCPLVFQTNQNLFKKYPPPFSWIERLSYRNAQVALAYSEEARQVLLRKGLRRPSQVVPYGTDLSLFHPQKNEMMRCELGLCGKFVLGYMGRLVQEKGLDTLMEAAGILRTQCPDLPFAVLLVGSGSEEIILREKVRQAGLDKYFVFVGAVAHRDAGAYLNCMDIFVLPSRTTASWKEQFGRVILEALACGIPVVGSDSGQIPHLLHETGGGLVFEEGDAAALAEQIVKLVQEPQTRARLGTAGQESVRAYYTYEAVARLLHGILQSISNQTSRKKSELICTYSFWQTPFSKTYPAGHGSQPVKSRGLWSVAVTKSRFLWRIRKRPMATTNAGRGEYGSCAMAGRGRIREYLRLGEEACARLWRESPFDLVHTHFAYAAVGPLRAVPGFVPRVRTFHGPWDEEGWIEDSAQTLSPAALFRGGLKKHLRRSVEAANLRRSDSVLTLSDCYRALAISRYGLQAQRVHTIAGGTDVERFVPAEDKQAVRQALDLPLDRRLLLSIRRLCPRMGLDRLIEAMPAVAAYFPDVLLLIGGQGAERERLEHLIRARHLEHHVRLVGFIPDEQLASFYQAADLFVLPTVALEGFGLVTTEALACGTPGSRHSGRRDPGDTSRPCPGLDRAGHHAESPGGYDPELLESGPIRRVFSRPSARLYLPPLHLGQTCPAARSDLPIRACRRAS